MKAICHRDYSILGTDIQVKIFDELITVESPGMFPGLVRPANIRHTHFSRNPKIASYMHECKLVKEWIECSVRWRKRGIRLQSSNSRILWCLLLLGSVRVLGAREYK